MQRPESSLGKNVATMAFLISASWMVTATTIYLLVRL
jgi:hypothetical protein